MEVSRRASASVSPTRLVADGGEVSITGPTFNVPLIASLGKGRAWHGRSHHLDLGKGMSKEVTEPVLVSR